MFNQKSKPDIVEQILSWGICMVTLLLGVCVLIPLATGNIALQGHFDILLVSVVLLADSIIFFPPFELSKRWKYIAIGLSFAVFWGLF